MSCTCAEKIPFCPDHKEPPTIYQVWWCNRCGEVAVEDPCQFCGDPINKYAYMRIHK